MTGHDKLVKAIEAKPASMLRDEMLKHVRNFEYHDFKSNRPFPKMQLFVDLGTLGYEDLQDMAGKGEFDDKAEE